MHGVVFCFSRTVATTLKATSNLNAFEFPSRAGISTSQVSTIEVDSIKHGTAQVGINKDRISQTSITKIGATQIGTTQVGISNSSGLQPTITQVGKNRAEKLIAFGSRNPISIEYIKTLS